MTRFQRLAKLARQLLHINRINRAKASSSDECSPRHGHQAILKQRPLSIRDRGASTLELALVMGLAVVISLPILVGTIMPALITAKVDDKVLVGFKGMSTAAELLQQLSIEGLQESVNPAIETANVRSTLNKMEAIEGLAPGSICASVYTVGFAAPLTTTVHTSNGIPCPMAPPTAALNMFTAGQDSAQPGKQVGLFPFRNQYFSDFHVVTASPSY